MEFPDYYSLDGVAVTNQDGEKLGRIEGLFVDDRVEVPTWVAVHSGLFGSHHALLPLAQARFVEGRLLVPYSRDDLALAPHHDPDQPLSIEQEQVLFAHYNVGYSDADTPGPHTGVEADQTGLAGSPDAGPTPWTSTRYRCWPLMCPVSPDCPPQRSRRGCGATDHRTQANHQQRV